MHKKHILTKVMTIRTSDKAFMINAIRKTHEEKKSHT